ncbi:hypothetical protein JMJ35_007037 [Cladonia borealis]|uniref:Uncharacterized protein n=1 Tax=Cladonia borealis TaxID=184061 RepID=A0AA39QYT0_9LECA|nr:hypothetical protein JMJ35_007037 [Cladonia borealis]
MQYSTIIMAAAAFFMAGTSVANSAQVNLRRFSYYDTECQDYAGHEYPGSGTVTGGPAGSQAIIWVDAGGDYCCNVGDWLRACKNSECNAYDDVSIGQCKSFTNGVWAEWFCIDCGGK